MVAFSFKRRTIAYMENLKIYPMSGYRVWKATTRQELQAAYEREQRETGSDRLGQLQLKSVYRGKFKALAATA